MTKRQAAFVFLSVALLLWQIALIIHENHTLRERLRMCEAALVEAGTI